MSEYIKLNDEVRFGIHIHNPAVSGALINADETPRWFVMEQDSDTPILAGSFTQRTGINGSYRGSFFASGTSGFDAGNYYEVHASGKVLGQVDRAICKTFVLNDIYDVNIVQVSGSPVHINDFGGNIYFADIKYIKDAANIRDEYSCNWFKNGQFIPSGSLQDPAISVYNTSTGSPLFENQRMTFASTNLGVVRYNTTDLAPSGEPFFVAVSGLIDSNTRVWKQIIGLDVYY